MPDLHVSRTCVIPEDELEWRFTGSGGPGGQHANTSNTRVELRFDIEHSAALGPRQRARLLEKIGPVARATASERRSQAQNRELARERLRRKIEAALHIEGRGSRRGRSGRRWKRRIQQKKRQGQRKRDRRRPSRSDD